MSDQEKIWFIYLTDHHEGPFAAAEIAEKAKAGLVNGQSLAWKDGMPEWVPAETIPELMGAVGAAGGIVAEQGPAPNATDPGSAPEISLAQLLAQSQQNEGATSPSLGTASGQISDSASVLSSMFGVVQSQNPLSTGTGLTIKGISPPREGPDPEPEPGPEEEIWTLKIGAQVSGLHSLRRLVDLAGSGDIPADSMLWHPGWTDFKLASSVSDVETARKKSGTKGFGGKRAVNTKTSMTRPGFAVSAVSRSAAGNDEEATDTDIEAPPKGLKGLLYRIGEVAEQFKAKGNAKGAGKTAAGGSFKKSGAGAAGKSVIGGGGHPLTIAGIALLALAGALAAYFFLSSSPIPSDLDVTEDDRQALIAVVKQKSGHPLHLAVAKGTPDNLVDSTSPKYYVASNLPEGSAVTLTVTGVPGTLVNRTAFEKNFSANVEKNHIATFEQIKDDGKPLWGMFTFKVMAEGANPLELKDQFIGNKGGTYQNRLKTYKESVQNEYDKEITELREYIATLKNLQVETSKQIASYKTGWAAPDNHARITSDWMAASKSSQGLLNQISDKLKERLVGEKQPKYHARAFQDVSITAIQLGQLLQAQEDRLNNKPSTQNADEIEGLVQAGVQALESWLVQAVSKNPFDSSRSQEPAKAVAPAPAAAVQPEVKP